MDKKRDRALSSDQFGSEQFQVMKLMEEIVEFDQEIKMKQKWINTRMKMLHQLSKTQTDKESSDAI